MKEINMGNSNNYQEVVTSKSSESSTNDFENLYEEIKEKDDISKGTYSDRYKVIKRDPTNFYDSIYNINTFSQTPNIKWMIETKTEFKNNQGPKEEEKIEANDDANNDANNQEKKEINEIKEEKNRIILNIEDEALEEEDKTIVGILGFGNVGKSYLLSLFTGEDLPVGDSIHTKGISMKKIGHFIILDSEGIEAPLTKSNISKDIYPKENLIDKTINESDFLIEKIARDKKAVELFIQDFIIEKSHILVIVVGQLTLQEQKLINRVVTMSKNKVVYVIHNLKNFYSKEQILDYIENTFKKNVFFHGKNFTEQNYKLKKDLANKAEEYNKYYHEIYEHSDYSQTKVLHFIMGSNVKESKTYNFNKTVHDFFKNEISIYNGCRFNFLKELQKFIVDRGSKYIESIELGKFPFYKDDIKLIKEGEVKYISIKNENNRIKKYNMNQLGFSQFYGALYSPNFICYEETDKDTQKRKLIVEINTPGRGFEFDQPKREEIFNDGHKIVLSFTGNKKLKEYNDFELGLSNIDSGNFRIDVYLDYDLYPLKEGAQVSKNKLKGATRFTFLLNDNNPNNNEMKDVEIIFSKSEKKEKEKKEKNAENQIIKEKD